MKKGRTTDDIPYLIYTILDIVLSDVREQSVNETNMQQPFPALSCLH